MRTFEWSEFHGGFELSGTAWSVQKVGPIWEIFYGSTFYERVATEHEAKEWVKNKVAAEARAVEAPNIAPTTRLTPRQVDSLARQLAQHRDSSAQLAELVALADNAPALNGLGKILTGWLPGRAPGPWPLTPEDTARAAMHGLIAHITALHDESASDLAQFVDLTEQKGETHDQN